MQDPRLPPELERKIFLLSLNEDFNRVGMLIVVARRVHEWIIPEAFKSVIISGERQFPVTFDMDKFRQYGQYIRSLRLLNGGSSDRELILAECLSFCPNLIYLTLWIPRALVRTILNSDRLPQILQTFSHVTHLFINRIPDSPELSRVQTTSFRALFPNLTHLAVSYGQNLVKLREVVRSWNEIQVVVIWYPFGDVVGEVEVPEEDGWSVSTYPPRVTIRCGARIAWKETERGHGPDIWKFAEGFIEARRTST